MLFTALIAGNVDFISIDIWHIVVAIGNLFILTLILKKFLFKPVQKILKQREDEVNKTVSYTHLRQPLQTSASSRCLFLPTS